MKKNIARMSDKQKLDYIIERLDKIERAVNPPLLVRILRWVLGHWLILGILAGLSYATFHMWDEIQLLIQFVDQVNQSVETMKEGFLGIKAQADAVGDKAGSVLDKIPFFK